MSKRTQDAPTNGTAALALVCKPEHPSWCTWADGHDDDPYDCHGDHLSAGADVPATGGDLVLRDDGYAIPRVNISAQGNPSEPRVNVCLCRPDQRDEWVDLTPAEARRLAASLLEQADTSERD